MAKLTVVAFVTFAVLAFVGIGLLISGGVNTPVGVTALTYSIPFGYLAGGFEFFHQYISPLPSWEV